MSAGLGLQSNSARVDTPPQTNLQFVDLTTKNLTVTDTLSPDHGGGKYVNSTATTKPFSEAGSPTRFTIDNFNLDDPVPHTFVLPDTATDTTQIHGVDSGSFSNESMTSDFASAPPNNTGIDTVFYHVPGERALEHGHYTQ